MTIAAVYRYDGLGVRVECADAGHMAWLDEFLAPHFERDGSGPVDWRVRLVEDTHRFEAALGLGPIPGTEPVDCFALDSSVIRYPLWRSESGTAVYDEQSGVLYHVRHPEREVTLLAREGSEWVRTPLMRVVRELAMNHSRRDGRLFLHAAAVAVGDDGVVVTGEKSAGKTTLLVHLLRESGAAYLSNDRVLVSLDSSPPVLRGMPTVVTVRPGTVDLLPGFGRSLAESSFGHRWTIEETRTPRPVRRLKEGKFGLTPAQFRALVGTPAAAACRARAVVFPRVTNLPGGARLRALDTEEAAARLPSVLFGAGSLRKTSELFVSPDETPAPDESALARFARRFAAEVRCFECELGLNAYDGPVGGPARDLLARVIG